MKIDMLGKRYLVLFFYIRKVVNMSKIYDKYVELKNENSEVMYLFKSGKFYIFIGDDADLINQYIPLKKVKFTNDAMKCGFPENVLDDYLRAFHNLKLNIKIVEDFSLKANDNLEEYIMSLDIDHIKPIDALIILNKIKEMVINNKK